MMVKKKQSDFPFILAIVALMGAAVFIGLYKPSVDNPPILPPPSDSSSLKSFKSWDEVSQFLASANTYGYSFYGRGGVMVAEMATGAPTQAPGSKADSSAVSSDYSQTNVQVAGVDEADIVKNDGKYIYTVGTSYDLVGQYGYYNSNQNKVTILEAYPAASMNKVSEIKLDGNIQEILVYKDKLVVFGSRYSDFYFAMPKIDCINCKMLPYYSTNIGFMAVYDITDRAQPKAEKEITVKGNYLQSRMIDGKVYALFQDYPDYSYPVPLYKVNGVEQPVEPSEIRFFDHPDQSYVYNTFIGQDLKNVGGEEQRKIILMGQSQTLYVSKDNIYVASTSYSRYYPTYGAFESAYGDLFDSGTKERIAAVDGEGLSEWRADRIKSYEAQRFISEKLSSVFSTVPDSEKQGRQQKLSDELMKAYERYAPDMEQTVVSKISLENFALLAQGQVPGHILNQFSMDESNGNFRIATTRGQVWGWWGGWGGANRPAVPSTNNLYVLDSNMNTIGRLEGLAPGESIYSVRFMGERAYMVTFKKVDPLFVIDLSTPSAPKLLGKLKIPGYSDYLHPYDENYLIGIGKDALPDEAGDFAWYQGVKLSLFDVRDVENPKEVASFKIGDRGTDSNALHDHKAFLFSKERNLLVVPITLAEVKPTAGNQDPWAYGEFTFQGAYVFSLTPQDGFKLRGRITHADPEEFMRMGDYYWSDSNVKRSLYMDNYLYTISDRLVMANSLADLSQIGSVVVGQKNPNSPYPYGQPIPVDIGGGIGGSAASAPGADRPGTAPDSPPAVPTPEN